MPPPACSDDDFVALFRQHGPIRTAVELGVSPRSVHNRRRSIEARLGIVLDSPTLPGGRIRVDLADQPGRHALTVENGVVLIFGDAHYWPGRVSTAHRALVKACREFGRQLQAVICNGDAFDGASISRFPASGWLDLENQPSVQEEIEACQERLGEIEQAAGKVERVWCLGNHDSRLEMKLVANAPQLAGVRGTRLKDHFPLWAPAWECWINDSVVVKHRWKGGLHAALNNVREAGKSMVTHHLHKGVVTPWTDLNGTRYGVDSPCLADPWGPQFQYQENNPRNHRSGFVVLTFRGGELLQPEMVLVRGEGEVEFRGTIREV